MRWWPGSRRVWLLTGRLRLAEGAVLSACPRKDLERKAGEGSCREAEEARGGGCVRTGRPRPAELPDAGSPAPEPAEPSPAPPGRLSCLRFRDPSPASAPVRLRAGPCARLVCVLHRPAARQFLPRFPPGLSQLGGARRAACRGGGTATRTTEDSLTKGERPQMPMKLKIIWNP